MSTLTTDSGLIIEDLSVGSGDEARAGQTVSVHYTGWLTDGRKFDSNSRLPRGMSLPAGMRACRA